MTHKPMLSVEPLKDRLTCIMQDLTFMKDRNTIREAIAILDAPANDYVLINGMHFSHAEILEWREKACADMEKADQHQGEPMALQHMAVAEDGKLRRMTGRKMQDCELYAMPDGSAIRSKLFAEQPAPVEDGTTSNKYKAELYDEAWQRARDMGFANVSDALAEVSRLNGVKP